MIEEEYISFETAKLAKEKGLDILCDIGYYIDSGVVDYIRDDYKNMFYPRPTQSLLARWLREKHKIYLNIYFFIEYGRFIMQVIDENGKYSPRYYITYEDAMESALQEALKLLP